ncbi:MAG: hypothetical protein ACREF5_00575 [Candidatus Saccharimonadales bacterium]
MNQLQNRFPIYSKIIGLYPAKYRQEYGQQILQTTADMLDNTDSKGAKIAIWSRLAFDLPVSIAKQQLQLSDDIFMNDMPRYIKTNSLISGLLLLPFVAALSANGLDKLINNQDLYNSWLWDKPIIGLWVVYLPLLALLVAGGTYLFYLFSAAKTTFSKRVIDIRRFWPVLIPALFAVGIVLLVEFHDSGHCLVQNPVHLANHLSQTWQCTLANRANHFDLISRGS